MQKNWYLVYTKPKCEKKVAALLTKRKIENFCPQNRTQLKQIRKSKLVDQPLFSSYVFIYLEEDNISAIRNIENVLNLVYWKGQPAIIKNNEISILKEFINDHQNIKLEKTCVDQKSNAKLVDRPEFSRDGNLLTLKNKSIKVNLPSIGYTLVAELSNKSIIGSEIKFSDKALQLQ